MKTFNTQANIGRVRYVVNFHDGVKTHKDGSAFFDTRCFSNKRKQDAFIRALRRAGYTEAP